MNIRCSFLFFLVFVGINYAQDVNKDCTLVTNKKPGKCQLSSQCPKASYIQGDPVTACEYEKGEPTVCCPDEVPENVELFGHRASEECQKLKDGLLVKTYFAGLSADPQFREHTSEDCDAFSGTIVGGEKAKKGEFPHAAAIMTIGTNKAFCGGSLISPWFVLTAAHCVAGINESTIVRLGDLNLSDNSDDLIGVDFKIDKTIKHPAYSSSPKQHDIALIKLAREVVPSKLYRPACLWSKHEIETKIATASGWGFEGTFGTLADDLMRVDLDILTQDKCIATFMSATNRIRINENQICAGKLSEKKDTCKGDSGGPLEITLPDSKCIHYIIGVTSFGGPECAKETPAVYTRVSSYINWIGSEIWK